MKFHPQVLTKEQLTFLKKGGGLKESGFYLAGGTALALQIGHRTSVDLDFYNQQVFKQEGAVRALTTNLPQVEITATGEGTIFGKFNKTEFSIFHYPYKLLKPSVLFQNTYLASIEDIAAMKIGAIIQRGTKRDFIDIYYLLNKFSLDELIKLTIKKYPGYQEMLILRALFYFEDAEKEKKKRPIKIFDKNFSWKMAKEEIFKEVKKYQLGMIRT